MNYFELREKYPNFFYNYYKIYEDSKNIYIEYEFEIQNLTKFHPKIEILKKKFKFKEIDSNSVKNIVFSLGMVEAISYFKTTCSPQFFIKCGKLNEFQKKWFKKLYYLGLGEFRYKNNIKIDENHFINFISEGKEILEEEVSEELDGIIIPIGGRKRF